MPISVFDSLEDIGGGSDRLIQIGELGEDNILLLVRKPFAPSLKNRQGESGHAFRIQ